MKDYFARLQQGRDQAETTPANSETDKSTPSGSQNLTSSSTSPPELDGDTPLPWLDSIDLDDSIARQLFTEYKQILMPELPLVIIPRDTTFDELKQKSPILLLATVTAASSANKSELFVALHSRLKQVVLDKAMIRGEKTVDLIEAIEILVGWFCPPDDIKYLNFYQYVHIAATMALELGLVGVTQDEPGIATTGDHNIRTERLTLAVYLSCSSSAMSLRRKNILPFTTHTRRVLTKLTTSPALMDRKLAALVELQLIAEAADQLRSTSSEGGPGAEHVVLRIQQVEQNFERWSHALAADVRTDTLMLRYHDSRSKLYEAALRNNKGMSSLVPPYLPFVTGTEGERNDLTWTEERAALSISGEYRSIMQTMLAVSPDKLRHYPTVNFAKIAHAAKGLFVLRGVLDKSQGGSGSNMINVDVVLAMKDHLDTTAGAFECKIAAKISWLLSTISKAASEEGDLPRKTPDPDEQPEPWSLSIGYFGLMDEDNPFSFDIEPGQPYALPFGSTLPGDDELPWDIGLTHNLTTVPGFEFDEYNEF